MIDLRRGLIAVSIFCMPALCSADRLEDPIASGSYPPGAAAISPHEAAELIGPAEAWRVRALGAVNAAHSGAEDFAVVRDGVGLRLPGRDMATEFLVELSDLRLSECLAREPDELRYETREIAARLAVAEAVVQRPGLSSRHGEALLEQGRMRFLLSRTLEEARGSFQSVATDSRVPVAEAAEAYSYASALSDVASVPAFNASRELLQLAKDYRRREQQGWLASLVLKPIRAGGIQAVHPEEWGGDCSPFLVTARMAFEVWDGRLLSTIREAARTWTPLSPDQRAEALFWPSMFDYAQGRYEKAVEGFLEIDDLGAQVLQAAQAAVMLGDSFHMNRDYVLAATAYYDAADRFSASHPEVAAEAQQKFDTLVAAGLVDRLGAISSFQGYKKNRVANAASLPTAHGEEVE